MPPAGRTTAYRYGPSPPPSMAPAVPVNSTVSGTPCSGAADCTATPSRSALAAAAVAPGNAISAPTSTTPRHTVFQRRDEALALAVGSSCRLRPLIASPVLAPPVVQRRCTLGFV